METENKKRVLILPPESDTPLNRVKIEDKFEPVDFVTDLDVAMPMLNTFGQNVRDIFVYSLSIFCLYVSLADFVVLDDDVDWGDERYDTVNMVFKRMNIDCRYF